MRARELPALDREAGIRAGAATLRSLLLALMHRSAWKVNSPKFGISLAIEVAKTRLFWCVLAFACCHTLTKENKEV